MRRALLGAAILTALVLGQSSAGADPAVDSYEAEFVQILNGYRAAQNPPLAPVVVADVLNKSADWMSFDLGINSNFNHEDNCNWATDCIRGHTNGINVRDPWTRMCDFGYCYLNGVGENIAWGYSSAQEAFDFWRNSPSHNANLLYPAFRYIGVARVSVPGSMFGVYWTTDFGSHQPCPLDLDHEMSINVADVLVFKSKTPSHVVYSRPSTYFMDLVEDGFLNVADIMQFRGHVPSVCPA